MVHNNKILTVSYGTFSCTLEGFDDSFGTMKAIAEYFRDLAADDRYFGAEPPQPDADMLARIAQRAISRQVEVHEETGGFVLRAGEAPAALAPDTAEDTTAPAETTPAEVPGKAPASQAETAAEQPAPAPGMPVTEDSEPVAPAASRPPAETPVPELSDQDAVIDLNTKWTGTSGADASQPPDTAAQSVSEPVSEFAPEPEPASRIVPAADSIAAKLQRIRAVVSQNEAAAQTPAGSSDYTEDEHADAFVAAAASDLTEALQADDEQEIAEQDGDAEVSAILDGLDHAGDDGYDDTHDDRTATGDVTEEVMAEGTEFVAAGPAGDVRAAPDDNAGAAVSEPAPGDTGADKAELFADLDDQIVEPADIDEVANILGDDEDIADTEDLKDDEDGQSRRARVAKVRRADLDAAIAAGEIEEIGDDADAGTPAGNLGTLSPEDEDDLLRELARVESELNGAGPVATDDDDAGPGDMPADKGIADEAAHAELMTAQDKAEEDLSRLMAAADERMEEPETSSRREAYNQLRAAVAVTESERRAGGTADEEKADDVYREDLASVVRPRRPVPGTANRPARPVVDDRAAPLKLVAEQRVDETGQAPRGPVRPRRVAATEAEESGQAETVASEGGFAQYAAEMGAVDLPDLLEAAASYMSFVEGHDQFSRPQLMNKVRQAGTRTFNREDGLRSFGQLLRDGKIEKTGGGRFTASREIGFRPDERAAG